MCADPGAKAEISEIKKRLDKLDVTIEGNGRPGLRERITTLEQSDRTQVWLLRVVLAAVITTLIKQFAG